jgi:cobaltochelatase CobT
MWRYGDKAFSEYQELPPDQPIGWMLREFEQHRTMREAGEEFRGSKEIMSTGVSNRMQDQIIPKVSEMDPKAQAIIEAGAEASSHWNSGFAGAVPELMSHVLRNDEAKGMVEKLDEMEFHDQLNECETVDDSLQLAKRTFKQLWEEDPDEQEKKERESGEGEPGDGEGEPGEGEGQGEGEGKGKTMMGTNPHSASDSTDDALVPPSVDSDGNCDRPTGGTGVHVETTPPAERVPTFEAPDAIIHVDFKADPRAQRNDHNIVGWADHQGIDLSGASAAMFANKLRRHIMVQSQSFYTHGHRRGKIGTRHLYKLLVDHTMPGEDRLFKRKHDSDILDTAIMVCVDYSGSMMGERTVLTHVGTDLMVHALQVLGVPVEVDMFSTIGDGTTMYTVKHFDERINSELLLDRSERAAMDQSNNNDAAAVLWCYNRLMRRPEERKILLVLSDGHPATHNVRNPQEALLHVVKGIEADPRVELMGLGITCDAVKRYYTQSVVVHKAPDMSTALIDLIANKMLADSKRS